MRTVNFSKTLCGALALTCIAAGAACQQSARAYSSANKHAATTTVTPPNPSARALQLERSVYSMSHRESMYFLLNQR